MALAVKELMTNIPIEPTIAALLGGCSFGAFRNAMHHHCQLRRLIKLGT